MSLATRCPTCGTVFRVVQDQLRVSEGWVRCGRCDGVFNATEVLFDIDSGAPVRMAAPSAGAEAAPPPPAASPTPAPAPSPAPTPRPAAPPAPAAPFDAPAAPAWSLPDAAPGDRHEPRFDDRPPAPAARWAPSADTQREEPLLRAPSSLADDEITITDHAPAAGPALADRPPATAPSPAPAAAMPPAAPAQAADLAPSFLRTADRAARWRHPAVRAGLVAGVLLLALALVLQVALVWRDSLAAHLPASEGPLRGLCRLAGCTVQPLRRLDALSVDSSGLNRLDGSTLYRLQVVLHNRADTAVMMPALDLSLTDAQGKLVSRRVLQVAELGVPQAVMAAGQELPIKVLVATGDRRVDGYTLELFYP